MCATPLCAANPRNAFRKPTRSFASRDARSPFPLRRSPLFALHDACCTPGKRGATYVLRVVIIRGRSAIQAPRRCLNKGLGCFTHGAEAALAGRRANNRVWVLCVCLCLSLLARDLATQGKHCVGLMMWGEGGQQAQMGRKSGVRDERDKQQSG